MADLRRGAALAAETRAARTSSSERIEQMGNGSSWVGDLPVTLYDPDHGIQTGNLSVGEWWTPSEHGIEVTAYTRAESGNRLTPFLQLDDDEAFVLVAYLLEATAPAAIPGNGREAWGKHVRELADQVINVGRDGSKRLSEEEGSDSRLITRKQLSALNPETFGPPF